MKEELSIKRKTRRDHYADATHLEIADSLDMELIEDIFIATPHITSLVFVATSDGVFNTAGLEKLSKVSYLQIIGGHDLEGIDLEGLRGLHNLEYLNIDIEEKASIGELNLSVIAGNKSIKSISIDCPARVMKLDGLANCPNLRSLSFIGTKCSEIDLSPLTDAPSLEDIQIMYFGRETYDKSSPFEITLPKNVPLQLLVIAGFLETDSKVDVNLSIVRDLDFLSVLHLYNVQLTSFDFELLSSVERFGQISLEENKIQQVDITPIIEKQMFVRVGFPLMIDKGTSVIIRGKTKEEVEEIISRPNEEIEIPSQTGPVKYLFGYNWLREILDSFEVKWV